jgi:hypothetical protein
MFQPAEGPCPPLVLLFELLSALARNQLRAIVTLGELVGSPGVVRRAEFTFDVSAPRYAQNLLPGGAHESNFRFAIHWYSPLLKFLPLSAGGSFRSNHGCLLRSASVGGGGNPKCGLRKGRRNC